MINRRRFLGMGLTTLMSALSARFISAQSAVLTITSPTRYRTFQRTGGAGSIAISGTILIGGTQKVQAKFDGGAWTQIANTSGAFNVPFAVPAGQGNLKVRLKGYNTEEVTIRNVGVGDVFICAGQSNMRGHGLSNQAWSHPSLIATLDGNDYNYKVLVDPYDTGAGQIDTVSQDSSAAIAGSVIPLIATQHMAAAGVPFSAVPCALSGSGIVSWLPGADHFNRSTLYGSMAYRARVSGAKVVLWWQGEADALAGMSQATYAGYLNSIADAINADLGVKLMPCALQNSTGIADANEAAINAAIMNSWNTAHVAQGPDLRDMVSDDAYHLQTNAKLQEAANRWWARIAAVL